MDWDCSCEANLVGLILGAILGVAAPGAPALPFWAMYL